MNTARLSALAGLTPPNAGQHPGPAPWLPPTTAPALRDLVESLARRINGRTGAPLEQLLDAGARGVASPARGTIATIIRRAMFDSIRQGSPGLPPQQLQRGIDAYRATLQTMAAIEAGGSGDDDGDFRRLMAQVAHTARCNPAGARLKHTIATVIAGFPAREQIILQLSLVDESSIAEIASILDISQGSTARIRRAAIGRLRHELACLPAS